MFGFCLSLCITLFTSLIYAIFLNICCTISYTATTVHVATSGDVFIGRHGHTAIVHPFYNSVFVFGGFLSNSVGLSNDVWRLVYTHDEATAVTAGVWTQLSVGGYSARSEHTAVVDEFTDKVYLIGGDSGTAVLNDVWMYDISSGWLFFMAV